MRKRTDGSDVVAAAGRYERDNMEAARRILADPGRYPVGSAMQIWATLIANKRLPAHPAVMSGGVK